MREGTEMGEVGGGAFCGGGAVIAAIACRWNPEELCTVLDRLRDVLGRDVSTKTNRQWQLRNNAPIGHTADSKLHAL